MSRGGISSGRWIVSGGGKEKTAAARPRRGAGTRQQAVVSGRRNRSPRGSGAWWSGGLGRGRAGPGTHSRSTQPDGGTSCRPQHGKQQGDSGRLLTRTGLGIGPPADRLERQRAGSQDRSRRGRKEPSQAFPSERALRTPANSTLSRSNSREARPSPPSASGRLSFRGCLPYNESLIFQAELSLAMLPAQVQREGTPIAQWSGRMPYPDGDRPAGRAGVLATVPDDRTRWGFPSCIKREGWISVALERLRS
jgi:hypothetical protein